MAKFELGQLLATARVSDRMESDGAFCAFVYRSIEQYISGDWGCLCEDDKQLNDDSLKDEGRIMAAYIFPETQEEIWVITEWDRSHTTVLFPDEC